MTVRGFGGTSGRQPANGRLKTLTGVNIPPDRVSRIQHFPNLTILCEKQFAALMTVS
jgi:hypothetical protein